MRKSEFAVKAVIILLTAYFFTTCDSLSPHGTLHEKYLFDEEYWGEWIQMDTGNVWYFGSNYRMVDGYSSSSFDKDMKMTRQSRNVIEVTEGTGGNVKKYYLYASRVRSSTFEATAVRDDVSRGAGSGAGRFPGLGGYADVINALNSNERLQAEINDNGKLEAKDIIAGDEYKVIIEGYEFSVTPNADGDNVGTLTLTNGVNIKTSIVPRSSSVDLMRLFSGNSYDLTVKFTNIGKGVCDAMSYQFILPSGINITGNLNSPTLLTSGNLQSILPGVTKNVDITVKCGSISEDFEFKEIAIKTVDLEKKTWEDSVSLKINKESITFKIRSNLAINGVVIVPNSKTYFFKTDGGWWSGVYSADVTVPKYMKDYLIVFSGATAETEAIYSFALDNEPAVDFDKYLIPDLNKYWPNNTEALATPITSDQEIMAYLRMNSANYYKVSVK